ncbi:hypothetical protein [Chryseobacterium chendengshani]|uniref:hypothetical protein n=1 Tax=unclassified Chryseobacterium TaxID=2593645 RepID=UPI001C64412C|nr:MULTISPECIES: hypothetical protein [unclassified Chryseobacterium]MBW7674075.1 hypothetical protein [Chryseobacterium sp. LJ756]MBW8522982.1 hypothetical protein [Chryseobacterium sp. LJ668]QYK16511.1 hypothetical protein K0U91_15845 [Chryseobacterium sp. LJ668]
MKKQIFKYKIIGVLLFIIELFILILFSYGSYDSFIEFGSDKTLSRENMTFVFASMIAFTAMLSIISILLRFRKTILILNVHYSIILFFFLFALVELIYENDYFIEDNFKFIIVFSIIFMLLFITNFFKYRNIDFLEIEDLGKLE